MIPLTYTDSSFFTQQFPKRSIGATGEATSATFTRILKGITGEINEYMDITSDFCTCSSNTVESNNMVKLVNDMIEAALKYNEQEKNVRIQDRVDIVPPSILEPRFSHRLPSLEKEKREEHGTVITYNLRNGTTTHY